MTIRIRSRLDSDLGSNDLVAAFGPGPWLVIAPHDDDAVLGCGLLIAAARAADIAVHVAVVTDGRMGWHRPEERTGLVERRRRELRIALAELDFAPDAIHELGFADGDLFRERGCREDEHGGGLGRVLTGLLRRLAPGAVFTCTPADLHPDHQVVGDETGMACVWAASPIWREFGEPMVAPQLWHYAVYCAFPDGPDRQLTAPGALLERKLAALAGFRSQPFIDAMVDRLRSDGPVEYFAAASWRPYRPADHATAFAALVDADRNEAGQRVFAADCRLVLEGLADWRPWPELQSLLGRPVRLVGEGSSRLFPAGFVRHLARRLGLDLELDACGGRSAEQASEARGVLWCSNSGATREVVEAARSRAGPGDLHLLGCAGGPLGEVVTGGRSVLPREERAVAATASAWLQAFELGAALAEAVAGILDGPLPAAAVTALAGARRLWWADGEYGLADELALKCAELLGRDARAIPGTAGLHGVEELFADGDVAVWFGPDPRDAALRERIAAVTGVRWLILDAGVPPALADWGPLLELAYAWRLLAAAAARLGRDPARPRRARKVGNPLA